MVFKIIIGYLSILLFQYDFYLGRANTNIRTKEEYYSELRKEENEFDLWANNGIEGITKWLYQYQLPFPLIIETLLSNCYTKFELPEY